MKVWLAVIAVQVWKCPFLVQADRLSIAAKNALCASHVEQTVLPPFPRKSDAQRAAAVPGGRVYEIQGTRLKDITEEAWTSK